MGEIADSMIYGEACEMCGVYLSGEASGVPRYCSKQCANDRGADASQVAKEPQKNHVNRNFSLKLYFNGEAVFTFKDAIGNHPGTKEEVMILAEMMHQMMNDGEPLDPVNGGSVMNRIKNKENANGR